MQFHEVLVKIVRPRKRKAIIYIYKKRGNEAKVPGEREEAGPVEGEGG